MLALSPLMAEFGAYAVLTYPKGSPPMESFVAGSKEASPIDSNHPRKRPTLFSLSVHDGDGI